MTATATAERARPETRGLTLNQLWAFLAVALPIVASLLASLSSVDLAYHLRAGTSILDTGSIPTSDSWTFTAAGDAWLNQQWGAQVLLALVFRLAGWSGLAVLRAALVGLTFGCLFAACRLRGVDERRAAWLTLAAFIVSAVALALRPQLFGMALLAATLLILAARRSRPRLVWLVPVIVLVWANIHGSFFLGPVVVGLAWLEDVHDRVARPHRMLAVAVVSTLATLVNPFVVGVWGYAVGLSSNSLVTNQITEWAPTTLRTVPGIIFFASVAAVIVIVARLGRVIPWPSLAWLGVFGAVGAYAIRGVAWWPFGAAYTLAGLLGAPRSPAEPPPPPARARGSSRVNLAVVGLVMVAGIVLLPFWRPVDARTGTPNGVVGDAPPGITEALRQLTLPGDRILNPQPWGSWLELVLPDRQYALDSRIEVIPPQVWEDYDAIRKGAAGWEDVLARWNPALIVADRDEQSLIARLTAAGWHTAYHDDDGAILAR